jgi:hypothetical protein
MSWLKKKRLELKTLVSRWSEKSTDWRLRRLENLFDDPIDWFKEKLHGMHLPFGYELNISFLMKNRQTTWDIIRKQGDYHNSDPEDLEGAGKK